MVKIDSSNFSNIESNLSQPPMKVKVESKKRFSFQLLVPAELSGVGIVEMSNSMSTHSAG